MTLPTSNLAFSSFETELGIGPSTFLSLGDQRLRLLGSANSQPTLAIPSSCYDPVSYPVSEWNWNYQSTLNPTNPIVINGATIAILVQFSGGFTMYATGNTWPQNLFESITGFDGYTLKTADASFTNGTSTTNWSWTYNTSATPVRRMLPNSAGNYNLMLANPTAISMSSLQGKGSTYLYSVNTSDAATTYTTSNRAAVVVLQLWGPGGAGAGSATGGGGASGAYVEKRYVTSSPLSLTYSTSYFVSGVQYADGNTGSATTIPALGLSAGAGHGGYISGAIAAGGTATGGTTNINGNNSYLNDGTGIGAPNGGGNVTSNPAAIVGAGGSLPGGGGGRGGTSAAVGGYGAPGRLTVKYYGTPGYVSEFGYNPGSNVAPGFIMDSTRIGPGTATVTLTIKSDGSVGGPLGIGAGGDTPWYAPITTGIGSSWWIRYNYVSGTIITNATWVQLSVDKAYTLSRTATITGGVATSTFTLSLSSDGGTTVAYTTPNLQLQAIVENGL